jgi:predicted phage terminase large subunit-like protein
MLETAQNDAVRWGHKVRVWVEQEPGSGGKESALISVKELARFGVRLDKPTIAKEVRARPFAAQVEAGNVRLVRAPWNARFIEELVGFPNGEHDDQVDAVSGAFNKLVGVGHGSFSISIA